MKRSCKRLLSGILAAAIISAALPIPLSLAYDTESAPVVSFKLYDEGGASVNPLSDKLVPFSAYTMRVSAESVTPLSSMAIPISFDNAVIKVESLELGEAFSDSSYDIGVLYASEHLTPNYYAIQSGTCGDLSVVNQRGSFLLTVANDMGKGSILDEAVYIETNGEEEFFVVRFRVVASVGADLPLFSARLSDAAKDGGSGEFDDAFMPDPYAYVKNDVYYDSDVLITTEFANSLDMALAELVIDIDEEFAAVTITDKQGAEKVDGACETHNEIPLEVKIEFPDGSAFETMDIAWQAEGGAAEDLTDRIRIDGMGAVTFAPQEDDFGAVTVEVSVKDGNGREYTDDYRFELTSLKTIQPIDPAIYVGETIEIEALLRGTLETVESGVLWTIEREGDIAGDYSSCISGGSIDTQSYTENISDKAQGDSVITFQPVKSGRYIIKVTSERWGEVYDSIEVVVNARLTIRGTAMLSGKQRRSLGAPFNYTARTVPTDKYNGTTLDEGIVVELFKGSTKIADALTDVNGKYSLMTDLSDYDGSEGYRICLTRSGDRGGLLRNEKYLCAEFTIEGGTELLATLGGDIYLDVGTLYLYAGAFTNLPTKNAITIADVGVIRALVGMTYDEASPDDYDEYNINEYSGVDASDLTTVRRYLGAQKQRGSLDLGSPSGGDGSSVDPYILSGLI